MNVIICKALTLKTRLTKMKGYKFITMKKLITLIFSTLFINTSIASDIANYHILKGKLHSGGEAQVEITENSPERFVAKMNYEIFKKILVPIPDDVLKGENIIALPPEFRDERGYMELETKGTMEIEKAKLQFIKRVKWKKYSDAYQIVILPKNGKSKIEVIYHPTVPAAGWGRVLVTFISNVPILNGYQAFIELD
jgi:hypothetical protein